MISESGLANTLSPVKHVKAYKASGLQSLGRFSSIS
jgi:hypothetical protein